MKFAGHTPSTWFKFAARLGQTGIRRGKTSAKQAFGVRRRVRLVPYRGFGNGTTAIISGRVFESREIRDPLIHDPWYVNFRHAYRHFTSNVVSACPVSATFGDARRDGASDESGYFHFRFEDLRQVDALGADRPRADWQPVELVSPAERGGFEAKALGQILVPPADCEFGVISDMDDTVIQSNVSDFLKIARLTMLKNARTRKPFEGVAAFYRALRAGGDGQRSNPLFYVSSSAWSLYDLFRVFLEHNQLPSGPILLRDTSPDDSRFVVDQGHGHKRQKIDAILEMYPEKAFLLIGDSGQDDAFIYRDTVRRHPGRVLGIYIRDVRSKRRERVRRIADELTAEGVPTRLVHSTTAAARHASEQGWITADAVPAIRSDRRADEALERSGDAI